MFTRTHTPPRLFRISERISNSLNQLTKRHTFRLCMNEPISKSSYATFHFVWKENKKSFSYAAVFLLRYAVHQNEPFAQVSYNYFSLCFIRSWCAFSSQQRSFAFCINKKSVYDIVHFIAIARRIVSSSFRYGDIKMEYEHKCRAQRPKKQ